MKKNLWMGLTILVAFGSGLLVGSRNGGNRDLRSAGAESTDASHSDEQVSIPRKQAPAFVSRNSANLGTTNGAATASSEDNARTSEETAVMFELARRAQAGEYLLQRDNPHTVREWRESVKRRIEVLVPPITADRHDFLSTLGVDANTVAKFTNHAARIAEASMAVGPLLSDLRSAKIEYEFKARQLLTPEQYERFKDFETRQAIEKELGRFQPSGTENLSHSDLLTIRQTMADLGIREIPSATLLPSEPDPTSDMLSGDAAKNARLSRIEKLDAASQSLAQVAERNHLSDAARQSMSSMIQNRAQSLRLEADQVTRIEQEHRAFLRAKAPRLLPPPGP